MRAYDEPLQSRRLKTLATAMSSQLPAKVKRLPRQTQGTDMFFSSKRLATCLLVLHSVLAFNPSIPRAPVPVGNPAVASLYPSILHRRNVLDRCMRLPSMSDELSSRKSAKIQGTDWLALLRQRYELERSVNGPDHPDTLGALEYYVSTLLGVGRHAEAEPLARQWVRLSHQKHGFDHPATLIAMDSHASSLSMLGRVADAASLRKEILSLTHRTRGFKDANTLQAFNNYAAELGELGRIVEAGQTFKDLFMNGCLIPCYADTLTIIYKNARTPTEGSRRLETELLLKEALELSRQAFGIAHPSTLRALSNYAIMLRKLGRDFQAKLLFDEVVDRSRQGLGSEHPDTLKALNNYAETLLALGGLEDAQAYIKQVLEIERQDLGAEHPKTLKTLSKYVTAFGEGHEAEAEPMQKDALELMRRVLRSRHPDTLKVLKSYIATLQILGRQDEAHRLEVELAGAFSKLGRHADAEPLWKRVFEFAFFRLGPKHPDTSEALNRYIHSMCTLRRQAKIDAFKRIASTGSWRSVLSSRLKLLRHQVWYYWVLLCRALLRPALS
mmetsp:Transcript_80074/g.138990  ORF Transcript_80074/g.138990 Transcript_80074/m.138990 type:complete len:556 (+) Transcript_80074:69-1736(+)